MLSSTYQVHESRQGLDTSAKAGKTKSRTIGPRAMPKFFGRNGVRHSSCVAQMKRQRFDSKTSMFERKVGRNRLAASEIENQSRANPFPKNSERTFRGRAAPERIFPSREYREPRNRAVRMVQRLGLCLAKKHCGAVLDLSSIAGPAAAKEKLFPTGRTQSAMRTIPLASSWVRSPGP